jgi:hypothetical protein
MPYLKELGRQNVLDLIKMIEWTAAHHIYFLRGESHVLKERRTPPPSALEERQLTPAAPLRSFFRTVSVCSPSRLPILARVRGRGAQACRRDGAPAGRSLDLAPGAVLQPLLVS